MSLHARSARLVAAWFVLASCTPAPRKFDFRKLDVVEVGNVPLELLKVKPPPARLGEITTSRGTMNGQVFAAIRTQGPCPRLPHTLAGAEPHEDYIELCWTGTPTDAPVPFFPCSTDVYVQYEFLGVPKDVELKFEFKGDCLKPSPSPGASTSATPPSTP